MKLGRKWIVLLVLATPLLCSGQQNHPSPSTSMPSSASSAGQQDDPVLKALNEMTIRAIAAEAKVEQYEFRVQALGQVIEAWKGRSETAETQLKLSRENRADAGRVFTIDQQRVVACEQQLSRAEGMLAKADARIFTLEHPGVLQELFAPKQLVKMGAAFFMGRATAKQ
jgi:hypothetical protein